eukprot:418265-Pyramimonas_sp.AAC.2
MNQLGLLGMLGLLGDVRAARVRVRVRVSTCCSVPSVVINLSRGWCSLHDLRLFQWKVRVRVRVRVRARVRVSTCCTVPSMVINLSRGRCSLHTLRSFQWKSLHIDTSTGTPSP